MAFVNSLNHFGFRDFICTGFDHDNLCCSRSHSKLEISLIPFFLGRIYDELTVFHSHLCHGTWAIKWNIRNCCSKCRSDHGNQLRTTLWIYRHDHIVQSYIITIILWKQRSHRTVDYTGGKNRVFRSLTLTLVKSSRDFSYCIHFLFKLNTEREEVNTISWLVGCCSCGKNGCLSVFQKRSTICLCTYSSDIYRKSSAGKFH